MARKVSIELELDAEGVVKGGKIADGTLLKVGQATDKLGKKVGRLEHVFTEALGNLAANAVQSLLRGVVDLARGGIRLLNESVQAAGIQQIAEEKLAQALRNTGDASQESVAKLTRAAAALQKVSNFGDESIITAQAMLLSFQEVGGASGAELLTSRLGDVAAGVAKVTGQTTDLNSVAALMGRALTQGAGALTEVGVSLTDAQKAAFSAATGMERVSLLAEILDSNFEGLAQATADPFKQLENAAGDLKEELGSELLPVASDVAKRLTALAQNEDTIQFIRELSEALAQSLKEGIQLVEDAIRFYQDYKGEIKLAGEVLVWLTGAIVTYNALVRTQTALTAALTVAQRAFNVVANLNPYALLATAIVVLVGYMWKFRDVSAVVLAYWFTFSARVVESVHTLTMSLERMINRLPDFIPGVSALKSVVGAVGDVAHGTAGKFKDWASQLQSYAKEQRDAKLATEETADALDNLGDTSEDSGTSLGKAGAGMQQAKEEALALSEELDVARGHLKDFLDLSESVASLPPVDLELPDFLVLSGSIADVEERIRATGEALRFATGTEDRERLKAQITALTAELDALKGESGETETAFDSLSEAWRENAEASLAASDTSIQSAKDAANAVIDSAKRIIRAKLAEVIAKAIASIPFPLNLVAGPAAAAGLSLLFNRLVPRFAGGVTGFEGGVALVGEKGPELVTLGAGSNVITNENTRALIGALSDAQTPTDTRLLTAIEGLRSDIQSLGEIKTTIRGNDLELSRQRTQAFKRRVGQI